MPGEEARQAARAGLHALLSQTVAQLAQEEARLLLGGRQDQRGMELGMGLDGLRGVIAAHRLGRNLPLVAEALRPAAGTRNTDPEASRGAMTGSTRRHGSHDTLAQVHRQR